MAIDKLRLLIKAAQLKEEALALHCGVAGARPVQRPNPERKKFTAPTEKRMGRRER